jgi:hypothetical protein
MNSSGVRYAVVLAALVAPGSSHQGSTPALHGRLLVYVWDHQGESFIVALDKKTVVNGTAQVVVDNEMYLKGYRYLYCIATP